MRAFLLFIVSFLLGACQAEKPSIAKTEVDAIYTHGNIWTGNADMPTATTMAITDGRITAIGDRLPDELTSDNVVDLNGRFVMAGFMDNHVHFMEGGAALASVDLRDAASPDEFTRRIADYAKGLPEGRWVLNGNWDQTQWADDNGNAELPHREWIDPATPDTPVYVIRLDGHMGLANSKALQIAGITNDTPVPEGGEILRGDDGELTGILKGAALNLILEAIPAPSDDELMEQFAKAQDHALSLGLTKVHAVTAYPTETTMLDIFQMAKTRGIMKLRAQVSTPIESLQTMAEASKNGTGDELLRWGGVKGFIDGSLGSRTAWMSEPYTDDPSTTGLPMSNPAELGNFMLTAQDFGLELSIHAIGDQGIDRVVSYMSALGGKTLREKRYRIEHFQHPTADAIKALGRTGIIASVHPYHAIDDGRWAEDRIGAERLKTTYPFRSILDAGGIMTFGSDWPVAPLNPMDGVYAAVTRRTLDDKNPDGWIPEQKITVEEALTAYTATNAYSFKEEDISGTLEPGKRADFVVLSADPFKVDPNSLRDITVLKTVIGGESVYERGQ